MLFTAPLVRLFPAALLAAALVAVGLCPRVAQAEMTAIDVEAVLVHVGLGEEESYKLGSWCPVRVESANSGRAVGGRLEVIAPDDEGRPVAYSLQEPFELAEGERRAATVDVLIGRPAAELRVRLVEENGQVLLDHAHQLSAEAAAAPEVFVSLVIGPEIGAIDSATSRQSEVEIRALHAVEAKHLPTSWWGYQGIDLIAISTSDETLWRQLDDAQLAALLDWTGQGGRLVLSVGARGEAMLGEGGPLAELLPIEYLGQTQASEAVQLETYAGSQTPLNEAAAGDRPLLDIALVDPGTSRVLVAQPLRVGETPLVLQGVYGLGEVTLVLMDLDQPPLAEWPALPVLISRICFESLRESQSSSATQSRRASHLGYDDMKSQMREALEQFPQVSFLPFWVVALLALVYIALIGPLDYFLLRWFGRRMGATWLTFPLIAAGLALVVVAVGGAVKSPQPAINTVEVIDIDTIDGYVRGNQWAYLYSPANDRYEITGQLPPREGGLPIAAELRLGWEGRSGSGFGGMSATGPLATTAGSGYAIQSQGPRAEIEHMPLPASSTRALAARWAGRYEPAAPQRLTASPEGFVLGSVENPLEIELRDAWLYHADWAYSLGDLPPGAVRTIDATTTAENLNWRLTRRAIRDLQDVTTPWDPASKEMPRILEVMLFHNAAGGRTYTRLSSATTRGLDLSDVLGYEQDNGDRAVLWGRTLKPAIELSLDEEAGEVDHQSWTIYRLVVPVTTPVRETGDE